ncbi:MAG: tRNA modification GTPase [Tunicatimonas sp.]
MTIHVRLLLLLVTLPILNSYAQVTFEKGYFINDDRERVPCLIKNVDWKNNPTEFYYKLSEDARPQVATIQEVREFGISDKQKYERLEVGIDRSSDDLMSLDDDRRLSFEQEILFLKVLVAGQATLYYYEDANLRRFFVATDSQEVEQLGYKRYKLQVNRIGENNLYRRQLLNILKCPKISFDDIEGVGYRRDELIKLFVAYNQCREADYVTYQKNPHQDRFNLNLKAGINASSLSIENPARGSISADFGMKTSYWLGVEAEFILPYHRNKWAIVVASSYQPFTSTVQARGGRTVTIDYHALEVSAGARHFLFLNDISRLYVSGQAAFGFALNSDIKYDGSVELDVSGAPNLVFAAGYRYRNRYSVEARYGTGRNVLSNYLSWNAGYQSLSLVVGYTLF